MRRGVHRLFSALCLGALLVANGVAGELLGGRFYTVPEQIYVNQTFEIHFELESTFGSEVEDLRISDFPNNPEFITVGALENLAAERITRGTQTLTVRRFAARARAHKALDRTFVPTVHCMLVERRAGGGFFQQWQSFPKQLRAEPFRLHVLPLPTTGRPENFSGAIGQFKLTGRLSKYVVQPGDIVTLSLELNGQGWLDGEASMPAVPASELFKSYPVREVAREPLYRKSEQVVIPQTTNATQIAGLGFAYFNPASGTYEESVAGPFRLTFDDAPITKHKEEVRVIDTASGGATLPNGATLTLQQVNQSVRHTLPLVAGGLGALLAFLLFFMLVGTHKKIAILLALLLLLGSAVTGYLLSGRQRQALRRTSQRVELRFAPSPNAATLGMLNAETPVVLLEEHGVWVRVDAAGRRGWIKSDTL